QPVPEGLQPPLDHPLRLLLLRRQRADDVLRQARRERIRLDVGDEAGVVATAELLQDLCVFHCGVHVWGILQAPARRAGMALRARRGAGGASISARLTARRASATTSLMRSQLARTPHDAS